MADIPFRLLVLKKLCELLETVDGPDHNGDPMNMVGKVFRGRIEFGTETELPAVSVLESPNPDIGIFAGDKEALSEKWVLLIQGWALDDKTNPSDPAYYLAAAVEQKLSLTLRTKSDGSGRPESKEWYKLGGLIGDLEIGPSVVRPFDAKTSSRAFFYLPIRVGLAQLVGDPYRSVV